MSEPTLSRRRLLQLFAELNDELALTGTQADILVVGGAAMVLAYDARPSTRDVDAIWRPSSEVRQAAELVARRHDDLPSDWLNDGVKGFLPPKDRGTQKVVYQASHLSIAAGSPEYLLASKLLASRSGRDEDDVRLLCDLLGITAVDEGLDLVAAYYPNLPIEAKVGYFLEEILRSRS